MDHPDELRIDLDPVPGVGWPQIVEVAQIARAVLADHGLVGWPKTSGSRGIHILLRIAPRWPFAVVRRAAVAVAREVERRAPAIATSKWWKEERHGVFLDYNQNARDRTTASAYSVRPTPDARVSTPLTWDELAACDPAAFTIATVPERFARHGDPHAAIDEASAGIEALLALADEQEAAGMADAPWPPQFEKQDGEAPRVQPSRRRAAGAKAPPRPKLPVITIAQAKAKVDALAGLDRWRARHPDVVAHLAPEDVLVDAMRGRSSAYYRVRINLKSVPEAERPASEPLDPDYDPRQEWKGSRPRDPDPAAGG
jgi:bifunctional non-homologous end joining protein LigD